MEDAPIFEAAVERLRRFLSDQGWPPDLAWRFESDIVRGRRCEVVVRCRTEAEAILSAKAHYEAGRRHGVGIALEVACDLEGVACATVYWTSDAREAEYRMLPARGLKLSIVTPHRVGSTAGGWRWWLAKWKARAGNAATSPLAAQRAVAADGTSRRR